MATMRSNSLREQLLQFSTCDISDALLKLDVPCGGFLPGLTMWSPERQAGSHRLAGPAYTARFVRNHQKNEPKLEKHYIDTVPAGSVIFIAAPKDIPNAVYGGLMSHRAQYSGAVGTIVDGNFRDLDEQRRLEWPLFARDVATPAFYEVARASEVNVPVRFHDERLDTVVNPGDWLVGDMNGVVCIPKDLLDKVAEMLPAAVETEGKVEALIDAGTPFAQASKIRRS